MTFAPVGATVEVIVGADVARAVGLTVLDTEVGLCVMPGHVKHVTGQFFLTAAPRAGLLHSPATELHGWLYMPLSAQPVAAVGTCVVPGQTPQVTGQFCFTFIPGMVHMALTAGPHGIP